LEVVKRGQENAGELQGQVFFASGASGIAREPGNEAVKKRRKKNRGKTVKEGERAEERKLEDAVKGKRCPDGKFPCFWHHTPEGCRRGTNCYFSHTSDLNDAEKAAISRLTARRAQRRLQLRESKGRGKGKPEDWAFEDVPVCRQFRAGCDAYGDSCRFSHE